MNEQSSRGPEGGEGFRPYAGVLAECRDLVRARLGDALTLASQAMEEELQHRRQNTPARDESLFLLEALYQVRTLSKSAGLKFHPEFDVAYQKRVRTEDKKNRVYEAASGFFPELALVDDAQINDNLAVKSISARLQKRCDDELQALHARVALILGRDEIEEDANPLGPTAIAEALKDMCARLEGSLETRSMLLDLFVDRLGSEIGAIYRDTNALLVSRKVLPDARLRVRRRPAGNRLDARRREEEGGREQLKTADVIQRLFSEQEGAQLTPDWATRTGGVGLMQLFTQFQRGASEASFAGEAFRLPEDTMGGATNVINSLIDSGLGRHLGSVDSIVIDVVATLFDYIFDDERVPDPIKGLIGRLQIPVLKLAMMDHTFFSNRGHPARRLINGLAQAGTTWDGEVTTESSLYRAAERAVLRIQDEYVDDAAVFAVCQQEFDDYLSEQERLADERAAALTERLKQREREELAKSVSRDAVSAHVADSDLPELVRRFLADTWTRVLARASLLDGEEGARWSEAIRIMDELVWSVRPKYDAESRQRLVKALPVLLKGLKIGMETGGLDEAGQKAFLAELVKCHSAALKASMAPAEATPSNVVPLPTAGPSGPQADVTPSRESDLVEGLSRGAWIELRDESGAVRRVRLTWVSPARTMYLFANRQGQRALALTRTELTRRLAQGEARLSDEAQLIDRVVDDVLVGFHGKK